MGMNRGGKRGKVWWNWREREDKNRRHIIKNVRFKLFTQKTQKLSCFAEKFEDIYCKYLHEQWKSTKGRNANSLLSIYGDKGGHPEEEVMQLVEVTTRWREGSPRTHSRCRSRKRDPQPESLGTLKLSSSSFLEGSPSHW